MLSTRRQRLAGSAILSLTLSMLAGSPAALADCSAVGPVVTCDGVGADNSPYDAGPANNIINITGGNYADYIAGNDGADIFTMTGGAVGTGPTAPFTGLTGDAGADTFNLNGGSVAGTVEGGSENDTFTLAGGTVDLVIAGDTGDDSFSLTSGQANDITGGLGNDIITLDGANIRFDINGDDSVSVGPDMDDTITLLSGSVGGKVTGGYGEDTIVLDGATVTGSILGDDNDDLIELLSGSVGGDVSGDGGVNFGTSDIITLDGASVGGTIFGNGGDDTIDLLSGSAGNVDGGADDDTITLDGATIDNATAGELTGGGGNDVIDLLSGAVDYALGGDGEDLITLDGVTGITTLNGQDGNDSLQLLSGSVTTAAGEAGDDVITLDGATADFVFGGEDDDTIGLLAGTATSVDGNEGDDTITLDGATVQAGAFGTGAIYGGEGNDSIALLSGSAVDVYGDLSAPGTGGADSILLDGATIANDISGGGGDDIIDLLSGSVDEVLGDAGQDTITLDGVTLAGINGGDDADTIALDSGVAGYVHGDAGDDSMTLGGATVSGNLYGDDGADSISLLSGSVGLFVEGGAGDDSIVLNGATVGEALTGDAGDDVIDLLAGSADAVSGGADDDTVTLDGASIAAEIAGGDGDDIIDLLGGTAASVTGGAGDDTITYDGATVTGDLYGDIDEDTIALLSGTIANVHGDGFGGSGDDSITLDGASVTGTLSGDAGEDRILLLSGQVGAVQGNDDDDVIVLDGATVLGAIDAGAGFDALALQSGRVDGAVLGGSEDDFITVGDFVDGSGSATVGGDIDGGEGADFIGLFNAGSLGGTVAGGAGDDIVYALGGVSTYAPGFVGNFSDDLGTLAGLTGGTGDDTLFLEAIVATLPENVSGFETVALLSGTELDVHNPASDTRDFSDVQQLIIDATSTLIADGNSPGVLIVGGNIGNAGTIDMLDGAADDVITLGGNYAGVTGASIEIDAALDASEKADSMTVGGAVTDITFILPSPPAPSPTETFTNGSTAVVVNDVGNGIGSWTGHSLGDGITVVDVSATGLTDSDDFFLVDASSGIAGPIQVGVFEYDLDLEGNGIWYLQSDLLDQAYAYGAIPAAMLSVQQTLLGSLYERVGDARQAKGGAQLNDSESSMTGLGGYSAVWARGIGAFSTTEGDFTVGGATIDGKFKQDTALAQVGADFDLTESFGMNAAEEGSLVLGISGVYGHTWLDAYDYEDVEVSNWDSDIYGGQMTATWYGASGLYADLAGQVLWYSGDVSTKGVVGQSGDKADIDGFGYGFGAEVGYAIPLTRYVDIVPNGRLNYASVSFDDFTDSDGVDVSIGDNKSLEGQLGVMVEAAMRPGRGTWFSAYVEGNVVHEFLGKTNVEAAGTELGYDLDSTAAQVGFGLSARVVNSVSLYAEVSYQIPFDSDNGTKTLQTTGGLRVSF